MPLPQFANCFAFYCLNKLTMDSPIQNWRLLVVGVTGLRCEVTRFSPSWRIQVAAWGSCVDVSHGALI